LLINLLKLFPEFLADRTIACRIIVYWHDTVVGVSVHLSVTKCTVAK